MDIAIAHEWIAARAGSEKVFEALAAIFPDADLFALTQTPGVNLEIGKRNIETTFLNRLGPLRDRRSALLPLMPMAWSLKGRRRNYDVVITSSHACVKGFAAGRHAPHFCYVHAPMRYVWNPEIDARGSSPLVAPLRRALKCWDKSSARWVDHFAANSSAVAERIKVAYGRDATVICPPVDTAFFSHAPELKREGLVTCGRLIPYKGHDIAIAAAARLNLPIRVVGQGPDEGRLRRYAKALGARAEFFTDASDPDLRAAMAAAEVLVYAAEEDFGIIPVEAQAAGTPVAGPRSGGLIDTVLPGQTGVLTSSLDIESITSAVEQILNGGLSDADCRQNAQRFSRERFSAEIRRWIGAA